MIRRRSILPRSDGKTTILPPTSSSHRLRQNLGQHRRQHSRGPDQRHSGGSEKAGRPLLRHRPGSFRYHGWSENLELSRQRAAERPGLGPPDPPARQHARDRHERTRHVGHRRRFSGAEISLRGGRAKTRPFSFPLRTAIPGSESEDGFRTIGMKLFL